MKIIITEDQLKTAVFQNTVDMALDDIKQKCDKINDVGADAGEIISFDVCDQLESIKRIEEAREVISKFMTAYFSYKDSDSEGWKITRNVIFYRIDAFNDRLGDILNIARSYNEFSKLNKKNLGGVRGKALMDSLDSIFIECEQHLSKFSKDDTLDPLDISTDAFRIRYAQYKEFIKELERRVSAILTQTFDECDTIIAKFKV
jgi:hypothetical protein